MASLRCNRGPYPSDRALALEEIWPPLTWRPTQIKLHSRQLKSLAPLFPFWPARWSL
jgi:hypothetical protein